MSTLTILNIDDDFPDPERGRWIAIMGLVREAHESVGSAVRSMVTYDVPTIVIKTGPAAREFLAGHDRQLRLLAKFPFLDRKP